MSSSLLVSSGAIVALVVSASCGPRAVREESLPIVERRPSAGEPSSESSGEDDARQAAVAAAYAEMVARQNETPVTDLLFGEGPYANTGDSSPAPEVPSAEVARCDAFWSHAEKFYPQYQLTRNDRRDLCKEFIRADERCALRAKTTDENARCNERVTAAECTKLVDALAVRYGTESFPQASQKDFAASCSGRLVRSMYDCLLASDESFNGCQQTMMGGTP